MESKELEARIDAVLDTLVEPSGYHDDHRCATDMRCFKHQQRDKIMALVTAEVERAVAESSIKLLQDFQPGKHTDPEHLATLMQEEICRLSEQLQPQKDKSEGL